MYNFITQTIGILGTIGNVASFQFKKKYILYCLQFFAAICFITHYFLLGSYGGLIVNSIAIFRSIYLIFSKNKRNKFFEFFFATLFLLGGFISIILKLDSYLAIIPGVGSFIQTIGLWQKSPKKTRYFQLLGASPCWMTYNIFNNSIGGILCEAFTIISTIIYLIRHKNDNEEDVI